MALSGILIRRSRLSARWRLGDIGSLPGQTHEDGDRWRPEDLRTEGSIRFVQNALHTSAFEETPPPRKVIKLQSWNAPELLAKSAPVHTYAMQIAVDAGVTPPLIWVANGDGPGSLQQLSGEDLSLQAQWQDDGTPCPIRDKIVACPS